MTAQRLILTLLLLMPVVAQAANPTDTVRAACKADVKANCGSVFSRSKALACLVANPGKLSGGCTSALKAAACNAKAPDNLKATFPCAQ